MLTLVAAVLAYDLAYDPALDIDDFFEGFLFSSWSVSRKARSETRVENDMAAREPRTKFMGAEKALCVQARSAGSSLGRSK